MKRLITLLLAASALTLASCSTVRCPTATGTRKAAIESVYLQRAKLKESRANILSNQRVATLMAIDVSGCPEDFRSAWFDYLIAAHTLHRRVERVAGIAEAVGKPVTDLPSLIKFAAATPDLGKYLLESLNEDDAAWGKVERAGMRHGVMPQD